MKTILSIPSGNRTKKLCHCIQKWQKVCNFEIHVVTWDGETTHTLRNNFPGVFVLDLPEIQSFAKNHNELAGFLPDWDVFICGADDLYPCNKVSYIPVVCKENPDSVIWVRDGLSDLQPTHPIITRGWYDKHGYIFDEDYRHNFCDTDLFIRLLNSGEVVKCFDIAFDHRHPIKSGEKCDDIYNIGNQTFVQDEIKFKVKHPNADFSKKNQVKEFKL